METKVIKTAKALMVSVLLSCAAVGLYAAIGVGRFEHLLTAGAYGLLGLMVWKWKKM